MRAILPVLPLILLAACATSEATPMLAPANIDRCTQATQSASPGLALVHERVERGPDAGVAVPVALRRGL